MTNTLTRLSLLSHMEATGFEKELTEKFSEKLLAQACSRAEEFNLLDRLRAGQNTVLQTELVEVPEFAQLYQALCGCADDESIAAMVRSANACGERLTQYPQAQVVIAVQKELPRSLLFEYMKYYLPYIKYEEEEQAILDNLQVFPISDWDGLSALTKNQRNMMRLPFLHSYLFNWHDNEREALKLLEQNQALQRICSLLYQRGVEIFLDAGHLKDLQWVQVADISKFRRLLEVMEYDTEDLSAFFEQWMDNRAGQYDLDWFLSQPEPLNKERRQKILCNQLSYLNALYSGRLHIDFSALRHYQFPILIYAVQHKKNHFLELVSQNNVLFSSLGSFSLLYEKGFCEHCNLNSLSKKNLQACATDERSRSYFELLEDGRQYTFEEMWLLWRQEEVYVRLYTILTPLPVDRRLLIIRQLVKRNLVSQYTTDEELSQLGQCLLRMSFSEWYQGPLGHIRDLPRQTAIQLLQHYNQVQAFVPGFQTEADAIFALNNLSILQGRENWDQVRSAILTENQDWLYLKEKFSFADDFVEQYRTTTTDFLLRGGAYMVRSLYDYLPYGDKVSPEALRRVTQAEMMGKFYELKYYAGDLQREIHYPISEKQETVWKKNISLKQGAFFAEEVDDFYHTMRLGELPHHTCLSYRSGHQRECLLASFDSNKKIILVWKHETVVARACIRLTKGSFQKPTAYHLAFADLTKEEQTIQELPDGEKLVLFLERIYTSGINDAEEKTAMKMAVSMVTQKAAELGTVAVLARRYYDCYERDQYIATPFYAYISKSKNGQQYLDSLGGASVTSHEEQYVESAFLVDQASLHIAGTAKKEAV